MAERKVLRVLILDDNQALAYILGLNLRTEGFFVAIFNCPREALKNIHEADVLLTDYNMPGMTGLEVARQAYAQGWRGALFIMSGHFSTVPQQVGHPLLRSILDKPFSTRELVEKLHFCEGQ